MIVFFRTVFTALTVTCGLSLAYVWRNAGWPTDAASWVSCFLVHCLFLFFFMMTIKVYVEDD